MNSVHRKHVAVLQRRRDYLLLRTQGNPRLDYDRAELAALEDALACMERVYGSDEVTDPKQTVRPRETTAI